MAGGKSASLLTQTQRHRLTNEFEDVDEAAKRRDQQLIRKRVRSGLLDFRVLADYPDRQYELAFEDLSDRELRAALADTYLAAERIRDLHHYDRNQLLTDAQQRAEDVSTRTADVRSLERLELHTEAEVRQQTENRLVSSRWERRAIGLVKLAYGAGLVSTLLFVMYAFFYRPLNLAKVGVMGEVALFGFTLVAVLCGVVGAIIIAGHALRYDITPVFMTVSSRFRAVGQAARRRWGPE